MPKLHSEPNILYVCSLCLREYELLEDLRGHMIEFHKFRRMAAKPIGRSKKSIKAATANINVMLQPVQGNDVPAESNPKDTELRPVPFKDFRLILRKNLNTCCNVSPRCPYKFENPMKAELHEKCHFDANFEQFKCMECSEIFNWRRCSAHLWRVHQIDVDLLQCPLCDFRAHASVLVWRHMRIHRKWRPRILRSIRAVQQKRQKKLENLNETASLLTMPIKNRYYSEKTCQICSRKFVNGKTLSKHVKTVHNKIKPFICSVCGTKTARKASLIIHMRQHTGEKPLQCKSCKFSTRDPSVLHKHQLRHEKFGKLKCTICDYTCIQTNLYKRHMRSNHPMEYKKIACDLCSYVTITEQKLQAHLEDHRRGLIVNCEDSMDVTITDGFKIAGKRNAKITEDCFLPLESIDSLPHEPAVDTGGVTIPAPASEDTQFPIYLNI